MTDEPTAPGARPTLLLVDGYALIYRAYHALPATMMTKAGEPTNAVLGFTTMLLDTIRKEQPEYLAVAFDRGRTFRHDLSSAYKATRAKMPSDLRGQIERVRDILDALRTPIFEQEGFEADDVIGTLAQQAEHQGIRTLVVTGDMDELQLVTANTEVVTPTGYGRFNETKLYDTAAVEERYGFGPKLIPDYKALTGDKSDNIAGVRGIGEKTATALLQQYGSLEGILEHLDEVKPKKAQEALREHSEQALLSKRLATIVCDLPLKLDLTLCRAADFDRERLVELFRTLEFRNLLAKMPGAPPPPPQPEAPARPPGPVQQMALFADDGAVAAMAAVDAAADAGVMPPGYQLVTTQKQLDALARRLREVEHFAWDVESTSKEEMLADLVGFSVSPAPGESYYIPMAHVAQPGEPPPEQLPLEAVKAALGPIFAAEKPLKDAHNAKYDLMVMARAGIPINTEGLGVDTMIVAYLLGERSKGLKDLAFTRLGVEMTPITALIGSGRGQITFDHVPIVKAGAYGAADADMTLRLNEAMVPELEAMPDLWRLFNELEMPLVPVLADMELAGIYVDVSLLQSLSTELFKKMAELEAQIFEAAGHPFNINSSQQLGQVLFEELALAGKSRTKTGYSTSQEVLDNIRHLHPIIDLVSEWRSMNKLKSTYLDALPLLVNPTTGRVHTSFNQTVAATGRLSSSNPNLQNIPVRTEAGRVIRHAFVADNNSPHPLVPRPATLYAADYSQIELRILAHMTGEETLVSVFREGGDVHAATAAELFDVPLSEVKPEMRYLAKRINFGVLYGMGTYGLTRDTSLTHQDAQGFLERYWARYPKIRSFMDETLKEARKTGYVMTLLGRRRYMPELQSSNGGVRQAAERAAINAPVQGTAADIIKIAMIRLHRELQQRKLACRMLLQVHDELLFELPEAELDEVDSLVCETMENAFAMDVPLKVETKHGRSWGEME
ncbi:MAG: DNA polymerase I [Chloroflexia bacterium]